ncbi:MAG: archaellin/type IV pilin N-terminal domain-containing protein [Candidatus Aenigmatarchaeota archaeon]
MDMLAPFSGDSKGISPLIAAVLLIAFTMTIAAILATWAQSFGEERLGEATERGEEAVECPRLSMDIQSASWTNDHIEATVYNSMTENASNIRFVVYEDDSPTQLDLTEDIEIESGGFEEVTSEDDSDVGTPDRLDLQVNPGQCPDVQPIDTCEEYDAPNFIC